MLCTITSLSLADVVYVHNDALGSPIMETDANGNVLSKSHYKPFGETIEAAKDDVGYTGHLNDTDLGLTYMQARYYDPVIGRFYSNDPVDAATFISKGNIQGFNRYAYANNNPYKYTDPNGENPFMVIGGIAGFFQSVQAVANTNATPFEKLGAVVAGTVIGAATGGRGAALVKTAVSKIIGNKAGNVVASAGVGATASVLSQNASDIAVNDRLSSTSENTGAAITGAFTGVAGAVSASGKVNAVSAVFAETALQSGNALAEETPPKPLEITITCGGSSCQE